MQHQGRSENGFQTKAGIYVGFDATIRQSGVGGQCPARRAGAGMFRGTLHADGKKRNRFVPIEIWVSFVVASAALLVIPGPTILTVISYSMAHGRKTSIVLVAAVALGDSTALAFSLLGLGAVLATSTFWFSVIRWAGGLYLLFLGISLFRANRSSPARTMPTVPGPRWKVFFNTYLVTALNPKGVVFFVAFLPQFVDSSTPVRTQLWILAITFVALAALITTAYAVFAGSARQPFASPRAQRRFNLAGGTLLSSAGVWALLTRRLV